MVFKIGNTSINPDYVKSSTEEEAVKHLSKLEEKEVRKIWRLVHGNPKKKRTVKKSED